MFEETNYFDKEKVEKILNRYPTLEVLLLGGMVSKKSCREILDIDKYLMDDIYNDLMRAGAIKGSSSSMFRAKEDTITLIKERRKQNHEKK